MAICVLNMKSFGRSDGSSAPSASAYRAGERIRDERTGRIYDHTARQDVLHKDILLPAKWSDAAIEWARDRSTLWNAAEKAETRSNARVAREFMVALPAELTLDHRVSLARKFSQELADRYGFALDLTVHAPRQGVDRDPRNYHAHLLATTREVAAAGLGGKTTIEWSDARRMEAGLPPMVNEVFWVRERWATVTNEALREADIASRIDHRTLAAQGIDREPRLHLPRRIMEIERRGEFCEAAEHLRAEHAARVQARLEKTAERRPAAAAGASVSPTERQPLSTLEQIRSDARDAWLKMRQERLADQFQSPSQSQSKSQSASETQSQSQAPSQARGPRDDFGR